MKKITIELIFVPEHCYVDGVILEMSNELIANIIHASEVMKDNPTFYGIKVSDYGCKATYLNGYMDEDEETEEQELNDIFAFKSDVGFFTVYQNSFMYTAYHKYNGSEFIESAEIQISALK